MKRQIFLIPALIWMIIVFLFSNENADNSLNRSTNVSKEIVNIITYERNIEEEEKQQIVDEVDPIVRKIAHFTLYTIGGICIILYINTYKIQEKWKIIIAICFGAIYAYTDELHQFFVSGRSMLITDVFIDTMGVITGVCFFLTIKEIIKARKTKST